MKESEIAPNLGHRDLNAEERKCLTNHHQDKVEEVDAVLAQNLERAFEGLKGLRFTFVTKTDLK